VRSKVREGWTKPEVVLGITEDRVRRSERGWDADKGHGVSSHGGRIRMKSERPVQVRI
jgi:hypothetical protein